MGLNSIMKSGVIQPSPVQIDHMMRSKKTRELVELLDTTKSNLHLVIESLIFLSEDGKCDEIICMGGIPKAVRIMKKGTLMEKKNAAKLIHSLIDHNRMDLVLADNEVIGAMLGLTEKADPDLMWTIAYCCAGFCSMGGEMVVAYYDGVRRLTDCLREGAEPTKHSALYCLNILASQGYEKAILKTDIVTQLNGLLVNANIGISSLARNLLTHLYNYQENGKDGGEGLPEVKPDFEVYIRPNVRKDRIHSRDGDILDSNGRSLIKKDEEELEISKPEPGRSSFFSAEGVRSGSLESPLDRSNPTGKPSPG
ncbi:MAG: hypothetical protein ACMUIE_05115 [Thermoplasmatota archaeon]